MGARVVVNLRNSNRRCNRIHKSLFTIAARAPVIIRRSEMRCEGEARCRSTSARPTDKPRLIISTQRLATAHRSRPLTNRPVRLPAERRDIVGTAKEKLAPHPDRPTDRSKSPPSPSWFPIPIPKLGTWASWHACRWPKVGGAAAP